MSPELRSANSISESESTDIASGILCAASAMRAAQSLIQLRWDARSAVLERRRRRRGSRPPTKMKSEDTQLELAARSCSSPPSTPRSDVVRQSI